jgi:hypothetical protein
MGKNQPVTESVMRNALRGTELLNNSKRNNETAFTDEEREQLGLAQNVRTDNYSANERDYHIRIGGVSCVSIFSRAEQS